MGKTRRSRNLANLDGEMFVIADLVRDLIHVLSLLVIVYKLKGHGVHFLSAIVYFPTLNGCKSLNFIIFKKYSHNPLLH